MSLPWPFPHHTPRDRERFAAQVLRTALRGENPVAADAVDAWLKQFDHNFAWLFGAVEPASEVITRAEAAAYAGVVPDTISTWVGRGYLTRVPGGYLREEVERVAAGDRPTARRRTARHRSQLDL